MRRLAASALFVLSALAAAPARAGWWDDAAEARATTVAEVRRDPSQWRDVVAVLDVRFVRATDVPADAPFPAGEWRVLEVAAMTLDAQGAPSRDAARFTRLVVRRGTPEEARVETLHAMDPIRVRAVVRHVAAKDSDPWVEAVGLFADGDGLTPEEQARADRARALLASDNAAAAEEIVRGLLAARKLAPAVRIELLRTLGRALRDQAKLEKAMDVLLQAHELAPQHSETKADLELVANALHRKVDGLWKAPPATTVAPPVGLGHVGPSVPPVPDAAPPRPRLAPPAGLDAVAPPPKPAAPAPSAAPAAPPPAPALAPPK